MSVLSWGGGGGGGGGNDLDDIFMEKTEKPFSKLTFYAIYAGWILVIELHIMWPLNWTS